MATILERSAPGMGRRLLVTGVVGVLVGGVAGGLVTWAIQSRGETAVTTEYAPALTRGQRADALRLQAQADWLVEVASATTTSGGLTRGQQADADRYQAQAESFRSSLERGA